MHLGGKRRWVPLNYHDYINNSHYFYNYHYH